MATSTLTKRAKLDYTSDLLTRLTDEQLDAVKGVIEAILKSDRITPFMQQSEEQLFARIDHSLAQIKSGEYCDAEEVENKLLAEIGV